MCKYKVATMGALCSFVCMVLVLVGLFTPEWTVSEADTAPPAQKEAKIPKEEKGCKAKSGAINTYRSNCKDCTMNPECVWCLSFGTCLPGTKNGPIEENGGKCPVWEHTRKKCDGMKTQRYGVYYYCEYHEVSETETTDFCVDLELQGGACFQYALEQEARLKKGEFQTDKCALKTGAEKDKCEALDYLCGTAGTAAKAMATLLGGMAFLSQFLGFMVGSDWMCSQHMRRRPKIWILRLKILTYTAAGMCSFGALCGMGALSLWGGVQDALLKFALNYCTAEGNTCPELGYSYYMIFLGIMFDLGAVLFFMLQPRLFGKSLFRRKGPKKVKLNKGLQELYQATRAQMEANGEDVGSLEDMMDGEGDEDDEEEGATDPAMAMRMAAGGVKVRV